MLLAVSCTHTHPIVCVDHGGNSVPWWVIPALSFVTVILGALFAARLNRGAQKKAWDHERGLRETEAREERQARADEIEHEQKVIRDVWLRTKRAELLTTSLPAVHNMVAQALARMEKNGGLEHQNPELGERFSELERDAAAASAEDAAMVRKFQPIWDQIGEVYADFTAFRGPLPYDLKTPAPESDHADRQRVLWRRGNEVFKEYDTFVREHIG